MNKVFVRLEGRLGNQLFQYAAARAVAIKNNSELLLDIRETTEVGGKYQYYLKHFNINARIAKPCELPPHRSKRIRYKLWRMYGKKIKNYREYGHNIQNNENILSASSNCYLEGYFQTEKYFSSTKHIIMQELTYVSNPLRHNANMLKQIVSENAISLHFRRGDYLEPYWQNYFAKCGYNYYDAAITHIAKHVKKPIFYIFSNDPQWVKDNIQLEYPMIISENNQNELAHEDLRLMSACKHNIIANSTFSWWGAYINSNPNKIVIAPQSWYPSSGVDNPDIVPHNWLQIAN